jgi:hypothetical protein
MGKILSKLFANKQMRILMRKLNILFAHLSINTNYDWNLSHGEKKITINRNLWLVDRHNNQFNLSFLNKNKRNMYEISRGFRPKLKSEFF